jgi:hypothetical protein
VLAALVAVTGIALAVGIIVISRSGQRIGGSLLTWTIIGGVLFNVSTTVAQWLITRSRRRIFLRGYYPFALGLAKLTGLIAVGSILLIGLVTLVIEPSSRTWLLNAVVLGLIAFAIIALFANGLLNGVIITRHLNSTLTDTSYDKRPRRPSLRA